MIVPDNGQARNTDGHQLADLVVQHRAAAQPVISPATDPAASVSPNSPVAAFGPGGSGTTFDQTTSIITLTGFNNQTISGLTVNVNIPDPVNGLGDIGDLVIGLITAQRHRHHSLLQARRPEQEPHERHVLRSGGRSRSRWPSGPYTNGTFESYNPLALANGGAVNGTYTLFIDNYSNINVGTLLNWSITVNSTKLGLQFESGAGDGPERRRHVR